VGGEQLKSFFPTSNSLPGFVKQAHAISPEDHGQLPDDAFALVLVNGDEKLRKFACIDEGNTALSVLYFVKNAHKLPEEAKVRTAENLKIASGWYGLDVPEELEKIALLGKLVGKGISTVGNFVGNRIKANPVGAAMTALTMPSTIRETGNAIKSNLARVQGAEAVAGIPGGLAAMGSGIEHLASADLDLLGHAFKEAEVTGTSSMPISIEGAGLDNEGPQRTIKKTSSLGRLVPHHGNEASVPPDVAPPVYEKNPEQAPQHMNPVVDVTDNEVRKPVKEKKASRYAQPTYERYPLDSYEQVKQAAAYFGEYGERFEPVDRREYCVNLVKRASELSIHLDDRIRKYGSEKYASAQEIRAALDMRKELLSQPDEVDLLNKVASIQPSLEPNDFAAVLNEFDRVSGIHGQYDRTIYDPYYSTFGFQKTAEEDPSSWSDVVGNLHITGHELQTFAMNHWMKLKAQFGMDFADEFKKDPIGIYNSMPVEQKKLIIRLATENAPV
jgi:hypothetical protein